MKKKSVYVISIFILMVMLVPNFLVTVSAIDGCIADPNDYFIVFEDCDKNDGCGFLWLKDTKIVRKGWFCQNDDPAHREWCGGILYADTKDGCC